MDLIDETKNLFQSAGGHFLTPPAQMAAQLQSVKAFLFDWDGVFHSGHKSADKISSFSEADSMGVNMLRFGFYLLNGTLPYTAIISGENNPTAQYFADREHLNAVYSGVKHKARILQGMQKEQGISPRQIFFIFDDILDLSLAAQVGIRICVNRPASLPFKKWVTHNALADYYTFSDGQNHAVREACELTLSLLGVYEEVVKQRTAYSEAYQSFLKLRNDLETKKVTI